jgi:hypothetical protein
VRLFPQIAQSAVETQAMVASDRGNERASFTDGNIRGLFPINTTAVIYLSFPIRRDPPIYPRIPAGCAPLLWVAGTADRSKIGPDYAFN